MDRETDLLHRFTCQAFRQRLMRSMHHNKTRAGGRNLCPLGAQIFDLRYSFPNFSIIHGTHSRSTHPRKGGR